MLPKFKTPFESIPFSKITPSDLKNAMQIALKEGRENVDAIINNNSTPTYENTIAALESSSKELSKVSHILFNLNSAETNEEIQQICEEVTPEISNFQTYVSLNETLYHKVKSVYENADRNDLTEEQNYYLDEQYKSFLRSGVNLEKEKKERLKEINSKIPQLGLQFGKNVLDATNNWELLVKDKNRLTGLPQYALDAAKEMADRNGAEGYLFNLQYPSLLPILKYAEDRELRKEIYFANGSKNYQENDFNNTKTLESIVALRKEKAELLGYESFSEYVLEDRMAKNTGTVNHFLNDLLKHAKPFAEKEIEALQAMAKEDGIDKIQAYDHAYYAEKLKEKKFDYKEEDTIPYFQLEKVRDAAFLLANKLFDYEFKKREDIEVYNPEVEVYEVMENGNYKALLYLDFHPRKGKRPGAWMTSFKDQCIENGNNVRPHISIVCNFTPPTKDTPSLLTFNEVTTLFHEFGHALHGISANTEYAALSGTSVLWDFVELPSQFMENYCYEKEFLEEFAKHYQTDVTISMDLIEKIKKSSNFMEGYQTLRQLSFGMLDMAYHSKALKMAKDFDPKCFEEKQMKATQLYPTTEDTCFSNSFSHIFAGGYASGYYSYKWSEVLDADAFSYFKENGIFNSEIAKKFKHLLAMGGTVAPEKLYEQFRGKPASNKALLERAGLM